MKEIRHNKKHERYDFIESENRFQEAVKEARKRKAEAPTNLHELTAKAAKQVSLQ